MPLPVMHLRNKQTIVKTVNAPNCHCEERSDVAISGRQLRFRREYPVIRLGTARLHPKGTSSRFALRAPRRLAPHNDKSGVITVLTGACTSRQRCAGSGMPLPYNSGCGRRNCFKICNCQWRSGSAATDAIGLCVFSVARANCKCLPEIATAPSGPRNDTSGECGGAPEHLRG